MPGTVRSGTSVSTISWTPPEKPEEKAAQIFSTLRSPWCPPGTTWTKVLPEFGYFCDIVFYSSTPCPGRTASPPTRRTVRPGCPTMPRCGGTSDRTPTSTISGAVRHGLQPASAGICDGDGARLTGERGGGLRQIFAALHQAADGADRTVLGRSDDYFEEIIVGPGTAAPLLGRSGFVAFRRTDVPCVSECACGRRPSCRTALPSPAASVVPALPRSGSRAPSVENLYRCFRTIAPTAVTGGGTSSTARATVCGYRDPPE
mmetsp:Transcript_30125/g.59632  ORF Transcript_30125/g.59632 Transcript_30125/m.59632 type:complete len:260 (+) Transcript_30125:424-1203(+)